VNSVDRGVSRTKSWGESVRFSPMDRVGMWLSERQIRRQLGGFRDKHIADVGCGHGAVFMRQILDEVAHATLVDLSLADDLKTNPKVTVVEGLLPSALAGVADASVDAVVCNNVLEHLWQPRVALEHILRILSPSGTAFLNVPSWRGKVVLETAAFRLKWTSADEIDDHKAYYGPRELWRLLVESGFKPSHIACHTHKLGLNTYAVCRKP
jgi:2-polyprenyl-3-methyl-5-hydroxy-6-metoxy-1,4-benzoquinol methylase